MQDSLQIAQGSAGQYGDSRIGFLDAVENGGASIDLWSANDQAWLIHWRLRAGELFPVGGHFLKVAQVRHGGPRAILELVVAGDAAGIPAPKAAQPVLPMGGSLDVGLTRLELLDEPTGASARVRMWPKAYLLSKAPAEDVRWIELKPGAVLTFGNRKLKVERIQPDAGDVRPFVVFSTVP